MRGAMKSGQKKAAGFTLIELMAVIVIIALLGSLVAVNVMSRVGKARLTTRDTYMQMLEDNISEYAMHHGGRPPESLGNLVPDYLKKIEKDPWGNDYTYQVSGAIWTLTCLGADGASGGEGDNADKVVTNAIQTQPVN